MNREEAITDFLKGLRIVFNNASAYPKGHPYFIKSVETFKTQVDALLALMGTIRIGVAPDSLVIDGKNWGKISLYVELAVMFHTRKIKSMEMRSGVTLTELVSFLSAVAMPQKEILRLGGIRNILGKEAAQHISAEELDYSQLLGIEGEGVKEVWSYFFKEAVERNDQEKIGQIADNFDKILGKFKEKELFEDEQLRENIYNFLGLLKDKDKDKFTKCTKDMFQNVSRCKEALGESDIAKVKSLFDGLNKEDLADLLWHGLLTDDAFDALSFKLFSRLTTDEQHKDISSVLLQRTANKKEALRNSPHAIKRIQNLLSTTGGNAVSDVYRNTLASLLKDISFHEGASFDRQQLQENYRFVVLNLLELEKDKERLGTIAEKLLKECEQSLKQGQMDYIVSLLEVIEKKRREDTLSAGLVEELDKNISSFAEEKAFDEVPLPGLEQIIDKLKKSTLGFSFYSHRIFNENKVSVSALKLLLKFFPDKIAMFYEGLERRKTDIELLEKIVKGLSEIDSALSVEILERIFSLANNVIRLDVLKSMQVLSTQDNEFLFSVLAKEDAFLRKAAVVPLLKKPDTKDRALDALFSLASPWGRKNNLILENLSIAEELQLKEAEGHLAALSKRPFFWNSNIRSRSLQILEKWRVK